VKNAGMDVSESEMQFKTENDALKTEHSRLVELYVMFVTDVSIVLVDT